MERGNIRKSRTLRENIEKIEKYGSLYMYVNQWPLLGDLGRLQTENAPNLTIYILKKQCSFPVYVKKYTPSHYCALRCRRLLQISSDLILFYGHSTQVILMEKTALCEF